MSDEKYPSEAADRFQVRMPDGMREKIRAAAEASGRSMNAEIVHRLSRSLDRQTVDEIGFNFSEDLNFDLINAASASGRSVKEEVIFRLMQSFDDYSDFGEIVRQNHMISRKLDEAMNLLMQLTPYERRMLEERAELAEMSKRARLAWSEMQKWFEMLPLQKKGRHVLVRKKTEKAVDEYDLP
jgi:hypothetical protein